MTVDHFEFPRVAAEYYLRRLPLELVELGATSSGQLGPSSPPLGRNPSFEMELRLFNFSRSF